MAPTRGTRLTGANPSPSQVQSSGRSRNKSGFIPPKMMVLSKPGNSGNFLKGNGSVAVLISAAAEQCPLLSESGQIVAVPRNDAKCRVEMWRGGFRQNISVAASFV